MGTCDRSGIEKLWVSAGTAVVVGAVLMGSAVALNAGLFTTAGAVTACIGAGAALTAAGGLLGGSIAELDKYAACVGLSETCRGDYQNLRTNIEALATDIGVAAGICYGTAAAAIVPWVPLPALIGLLAALIAFAVL